MIVIISKVAVVFIYILIGFTAYRLKILDNDSIRHLTAFIVNIACPALMINSVAGADLEEGMMLNTVEMLLLALAFFVPAVIASLWISRHILKADSPEDANALAFGMTTVNSGFMGFPISQSIFGPTVFYYMVIENISLNLYLFTGGIAQVRYKLNSGKSSSLKDTLRSFCTPITITSILSVFLLFMHIRIPEYAMNILDTVGDTTIPISMIIVGLQLGKSHIRQLFTSRQLILTSLFRLIVFPAVGILITWFLPISNVVKLTLGLSFCFPSAAMGVVITEMEGGNGKLMAEVVALTTLLSLVTLTVWITVLSALFA